METVTLAEGRVTLYRGDCLDLLAAGAAQGRRRHHRSAVWDWVLKHVGDGHGSRLGGDMGAKKITGCADAGDGLTATRRIREQAELRDLPVIALTAGVMAEGHWNGRWQPRREVGQIDWQP
jgi:hypothetical protein